MAEAIRKKYAGAPAGEKVPSTAQLARDFGFNENTVDHALDILFQEGVVARRPSKPPFFTGLGAQAEWDQDFTGRPILEVLQFRLLLEPAASMHVAQLCKGKDERFWQRLADAHAELPGEPDRGTVEVWLRTDQAFHEAIHGLVGNELFRRVLTRMRLYVFENVEHVVRRLYDSSEYRRRTQEQHAAMFFAITENRAKNDNGEAAWRATYEHLEYAHGRIRDRLVLR